MTRIVKDPKIRRTELIDVAEDLFLTCGYEQTAVSDIVKKVGVAQGTFYHYFKSKDDMLNAIIDRIIIEVKDGIEDITSRNDLNTIEKTLEFFRFFNRLDQNWKKITDYIHEERNANLHIKFEKRFPPIILPLLDKMIEQGVSEGFFDTKYPEVAAVYFLLITSAISHGTYGLNKSIGGMKEKTDITFDSIERILGARHGIFMEYLLKMEEKE